MTLRWIDETLEALAREDLRRVLRCAAPVDGVTVRVDGRTLVQFASNNYLDLVGHPAVREAAADAIEQFGWGSGASPLVVGWTPLHGELCQRLAAFEEAEDAMLFPSGYHANVGTIGALAGDGDWIVLDKLCHASMIDGARLSGATVRVYPHGDLNKAEALLEKAADTGARTLLLTDSVFSMDGDLAPLADLTRLCETFGAMLLVDEAHGTGVLGSRGGGACEWIEETTGAAVRACCTVRIGTLSKALGGLGGFAVGSGSVCELIRNRARSFAYSTALPAAACAAACAALDLIGSEPERRTRLQERVRLCRHALRDAGFVAAEDPTPIVPVVFETEARALAAAAVLLDAGFLVPAIRPPTVPRGTSRLRISLSCAHTEDQIASLVNALASWDKG